ncbi:MAG: hypothetical protein VXY42_03230 [Candidatus Thermoplasmatota archaeon]|nr:hypothetical protein [Candidatus Thermoplasmatota archaeon]
MEDEVQRSSFIPFFLVSVMLIVSLPTTQAENNADEFIVDGRVKMIGLTAGETYQKFVELDIGTVISVNVGCGSCEVKLIAGETTLTSSSSVTYNATETVTVEIQITSTITETVSTSILVTTDETHLTQRPSPQTEVELIESHRCLSPEQCIDMHRGNLKTIVVGDYTNIGFDTGEVELSTAEYFAFEVLEDEIVELTLHHASDSIRFDFYFQTDTMESQFTPVIESMTASNPSLIGDTVYLQIEEDGRIVVKVSTSAPSSAYALQRTIHVPQMTMTVENNVTQFIQIGHAMSKSAFQIDSTGVVKIAPVIEDITARLAVRIGENWIDMPEVVVERNTVERIHVYPNTTMAILTFESAVHWVDVTLGTTADGNTSMDAPGYYPSSLNETEWPILYAENTGNFQGQLSLATMDVGDNFFISVDGWVDSEHRLHIEIEGTSPNLLVDVQELDQETMEVVQQITLLPDDFSYKLETYITVGPGKHLIKFYHADDSILENQNWSNDLNPLEYDVTITKVTTEIGEEPWFAPSDEAKFWGSTVRWILGLGMILPALYLFLSMSKTRRDAARIGAMRERLEILSKLLDDGEKSPEQTRKSLVRSLEAVATLPWQSAIASWGNPEQSYTTDGTSIAVWNLDARLAKSLGNWPILVGLNTEDETWEVAAFRFDAPYGQALSVDHVEPRLLHRGEEVFIDAIAKGTTVFLTVDLSGDAMQVDIELNGQVNATPRAMRIPTTLTRFPEQE